MLSISNSAFGYDHPLLKAEQLDLEPGKVYALVGRNGSGKTTFFKTLLGLIPALSGEIRLGNKQLTGLHERDRAKELAFVPSRFDGVQHLTAYDCVALGRAPYTNFIGALKPHDHEIIQNGLELLQITHLGSKDTPLLSDGERQLVSVARAMVQQAPVLLLDEPTAFLDYPNRLLLLKNLRLLAAESQRLIIHSSHDLELCLEYSDEILVAGNGTLTRISAQGLSRDALLEIF